MPIYIFIENSLVSVLEFESPLVSFCDVEDCPQQIGIPHPTREAGTVGVFVRHVIVFEFKITYCCMRVEQQSV